MISHIWSVACMLEKHEQYGVNYTQTLTARAGCSENEAKGEAVEYALKSKPGFALVQLVTVKTEVSVNAGPISDKDET